MGQGQERKVHLVLQGKGGVGKTFVATLIAQSQLRKSENVEGHLICVDTDPVNRTLEGFAGLKVRPLELMEEGGEIIARHFDELMEWVVKEDADFVVDNGASSFVPLMAYMVENGAVNVMRSHGKKVVVHCVITGGQGLLDTLTGFDQLARAMPESVEIVLWLNEYFGPIEQDGKQFEQMQVYEKHKGRVTGMVRIPRQTSSTFGQDIEELLHRRMTFAEAEKSPEFSLMAKQRLAMMARMLFQQVEQVI